MSPPPTQPRVAHICPPRNTSLITSLRRANVGLSPSAAAACRRVRGSSPPIPTQSRRRNPRPVAHCPTLSPVLGEGPGGPYAATTDLWRASVGHPTEKNLTTG